MTSEELIVIGERLFGRNWQTAMAREIGVNPRTVRKWTRGDVRITERTAMQVRGLEKGEQ